MTGVIVNLTLMVKKTMTGRGLSTIKRTGVTLLELSEYRAVPTENAGKLGTWGEYRLILVKERSFPDNVIPMKDPMVRVTFDDDPLLTHSGVTAVLRLSKARYGVI
jgi:hypothetical protein